MAYCYERALTVETAIPYNLDAVCDSMTDGESMNDESAIEIYHKYAVQGYEPAEIAHAFNISVADVHEALAYYYRHVEELKDELPEHTGQDKQDDSERDKDYTTNTREPHQDIDVEHDVDMLRMERLGSDGLYIAGYNRVQNEPDYRYWIVCTSDGLRIDEEHHPQGMEYE